MKFYAGIGSRETPSEICGIMKALATKLEKDGWTLRSGGADGADYAFSKGVEKEAEIYLPWSGFAINLQLTKVRHKYITVENDSEAEDFLKFHPSPHRLYQAGKKLMVRNFRQIIGKDAPNSKFVICWTKDGGASGGTGQAMRIARHYNIPVFNLKIGEDLKKMEKYLNK